MRYNNYHKHDHYSNVRTIDTIIKPIDYINRIKELKHNTFFTTNHGCSGNIFEAYELCKLNNIKCIFGMEMYYVDDRFQKDRSNYHIIVIGLTKNAYYQINRISSEANKNGFYYQPRVDMKLLLSLPKDEVIITTACINNRIFNCKKVNSEEDNGIDSFLVPLKKHFNSNFMLEVQDHNYEIQKKWNEQILELNKKYNIKIIHGNDSHYIYPEQNNDRILFLKGKNINYGNEDSFVLDYPDYNTIIQRYKKQNILNDKQIQEALNNTLIFDKSEDLNFNKEIKMPTIYPDLSSKEKMNKLKKIIAKKWNKEKINISKEKHYEYEKAICFEMDIIEKTNHVNTVDYFLINERIINLGVNKYHGILTKTGRGSAVSFYINKLLGFTEVDRLESAVPLYPTRFMSVSRILETKSLPDIDFNTADPNPFIKASKEVLGEDYIYYMIAYGKMQESEAFRNLCRAKELEVVQYNEVAKNLDQYKNDKKWGDLIEESEKFIGVIDSISPSPCSFLLYDKPISKEIGLIKVGNEVCCCIDGYTSDVWKFLKNDILTVTVWDIISKTYKILNKSIPNIKELKEELNDDVWNLYKNKITATLNQISEWATTLVSKYDVRSVAELTAFVAAIRPSFASLLNNFLNRKSYTTGTPELDKLLKSSFHYLLYQENLMQYFTWLGIEEDKTYGLIKKIAKKVLTQDEIDKLEKELHENWIKKIGNDDKFNETWQVIQNSAKYGFNASHALSVALDSLYGANLKAKYPLEYYTVALNIYQSNIKETVRILSELNYFNIKFKSIEYGKSKAKYSFDKKTNTIYKGIASIKFCNEVIAKELFDLSKENKYNNFLNLLIDIKTKTSINSRQLKILTGLKYFKIFDKNKKLLSIIDLYENLYDRKQIKFDQLQNLNINEEIFKKYYNKTTKKMYKEIDMIGYIKEIINFIENKSLSIKEQVKFEIDYLEYVNYKNDKIGDKWYIVTQYKTFKDKTKPYITLRHLQTGIDKKTKVKQGKLFIENPFKLYSVLKINEFTIQKKTKNIGGVWKKTNENEEILYDWEVY